MRKINTIKIARHFWLYEFECPCCNRVMLHHELLRRLEKLRFVIGKPINITSGYRCNKENEKVNGMKNSYHTKGMAADIYVIGMDPDTLAVYAEGVGFRGIGKYNNFVHLDVREKKYYW